MKLLAVFLVMFALAPDIPRTWEKTAVETMELPLANRQILVTHIDEAAYYRIPERVIYKSYSVYAPGREPAGYMEWLKTVEPQAAFDEFDLSTQNQWIAAGEIVFNAPTSLHPVFFTAQDLRDPNFFNETGMPVAKDGTVPFARWVVRQKGVVELGSMSCAICHTRVLEDGTGNAFSIRRKLSGPSAGASIVAQPSLSVLPVMVWPSKIASKSAYAIAVLSS